MVPSLLVCCKDEYTFTDMMSQFQNPPLLANLQNPDLFDHQVTRFSIMETHISWILLTGDFVYKIKKPVNLGFLDFSTLEKRLHYCREELRLNGRLAPDIYLSVIKITGTEQSPQINGTGPVIEYAVKMHQFPQQNLLINLLKEGKVTPDHIDQLAAVISQFHDIVQISEIDTPFGTVEAVLAPVKENFRQIRQFTGSDFNQQLELLEKWSFQEHQYRHRIFEKRKANGSIRECHGDLHLGNIVLHNNRIIPFDGIEFNENLYWIDVISELAFLVMDLEDHQRTDLAFRILNAWLERTGDYAGLKVLRYYLVYRAMVRAKVNSIRLNQQNTDDNLAQSRKEFLNYLHLAESYTQPPTPRLIICHGLSASGKTTVSQQLLEILPGIRIRSDVERKRLYHLKSDQKSASGITNGLYSAKISKQTYQRLEELASTIIDAGYTVIVDAAFLMIEQREQFHSIARRCNVPFLIVHCESTKKMMRQRIFTREEIGRDASEAGLEVLEHQIQNYQKLSSQELSDCIKINTETGIDTDPVLKWHLCH